MEHGADLQLAGLPTPPRVEDEEVVHVFEPVVLEDGKRWFAGSARPRDAVVIGEGGGD